MPDMIAGRRMLGSVAEFHAVELGDGPPLLLLHGVTANAYIWLPVMELLRDTYRTVAVDQRGHGRTGMPRDRRFDAEAYARDAADLAAFIGGPAVLVGHSLGARNAIAAGAMRPDAIAGVIAIEFVPFIEEAAFDALDARVTGGPRSFGDLGDLTGYLSWRYPGLPADAVDRRARNGYAPRADGRLAPLADAGAMRATSTGLRADLAADLGRLRVPAVLVRGAVAVSPEEARDRVASLTGGRGADAVIEASGSEAALTLALELVSGRGTVSVVGAHFNPAAPVDLGRMFANETTLRFSIGAPTDDRERAANLILGGDVDPRRIISHRLPLEQAARAYEIFRSHGATKVLLAPGAA